MARQRDYAAEYARRQERARQRGFSNYYARRIRGAAAEPAAEAPTGERLRRLRGHASGADLRREAPDGGQVTAQLGGRDSSGRYHRVDISVLAPDGSEQEYTLRGSRQLNKQYIERLVGDLEKRGVTFSPAPSLDLRQIGAKSAEAGPRRRKRKQ